MLGAVCAFACVAQTIYGSAFPGDSSDPATLYTINPSNGAGTAIGSIGFANVSAIAFAPNGTLYGIGRNGDSDLALITINTSTGAGTQVALITSFSGNATDMAFRSDGVLFVYSGQQRVYTINTTTGVATQLGATGTTGGGNAIAFSAGGTLYHADDVSLHTVNQSSGSLTVSTALNYSAFLSEGDSRANGMKFNPSNGTLFASVTDGNTSWLGTINIGTGVVTNLGTAPDGLDAIAVVGSFPPPPPPTTPAPSSLLLIGIGLLACLGWYGSRAARV